MIYDKSGNALAAVYDKSGASLSYAYDKTGSVIFDGSGGEEDKRDWSSIPTQFKTNLSSAASSAVAYKDNNPGAYIFAVFSDVHDKFYNEPNYVEYNFRGEFENYVFLGDMANTYSDELLKGAVDYMHGVGDARIFPVIGNHEFGGYEDGQTLPKAYYIPLLDENCVIMNGDLLVYYYDDTENNVRVMFLDSCSTIKKQSGTQLMSKAEIVFCADAMLSAGAKDILLFNHSAGQGFYFVDDPEEYASTTTVTNMGQINTLINAFINRDTYSITDDNSVVHNYDFANVTGDFIASLHGHSHTTGHTDHRGYHDIICPSTYYNDTAGASFFAIDRPRKLIKWFIAYKNRAAIDVIDYQYGVSD